MAQESAGAAQVAPLPRDLSCDHSTCGCANCQHLHGLHAGWACRQNDHVITNRLRIFIPEDAS
jgi:hypothetical protein